jgi:hypothetical protein
MVSEASKRFLSLRYILLGVLWALLWITVAWQLVYPIFGRRAIVAWACMFLAAAAWPIFYIRLIEPRIRKAPKAP